MNSRFSRVSSTTSTLPPLSINHHKQAQGKACPALPRTSRLVPFAFRLSLFALCPLPFALCLLPFALCLLPALCPLPASLFKSFVYLSELRRHLTKCRQYVRIEMFGHCPAVPHGQDFESRFVIEGLLVRSLVTQ